MHPLAIELNTVIERENSYVFDLLSQRGKEMYFPTTGILGQTAEAKGCTYNATIGIALEDDGSPMHFSSLDEYVSLPVQNIYPYASSYGLPALRSKWQEMMFTKNPSLDEHISLPVVAAGLTGALTVAAALFLDTDDTLLLTDKYWGNYNLMFGNGYGANLQSFSTFAGGGFDVAAMEKALQETSGARQCILLNFPNNPAGYTPTKQEAEDIARALYTAAEANEHGLVVILDDAYFGLVYESDVYSESLFSLLSASSEKLLAVKIDGATKEDYVWGHRVGFITFGCKNMSPALAKALEDKAAGVVRSQISNVCHLSQSLLIALYQSPTYQQEKDVKYATMRSRYVRTKEEAYRPEYSQSFTPLPFNSGYFMCVQLSDGLDANQVRTQLLQEHSIGTIATSGLLRIAYSCVAEQDIPVIFSALHTVCQQLSSQPYAITNSTAVS